jgi:bifunctional non-homologous end joining protein LigD
MAGLRTYRVKRRFDITEEPKGKISHKSRQAFVVQKHAAKRLHYDLRLEIDGVMKSWAVTRGPSMISGEKRLAVQVEDHPIEYNKFEGTIPQGEYGAGAVMIWDRGTWRPQIDPHKGLKKGHLSFTLDGEKLYGGWHLVRMRHRPSEKRDNWLLIKQHDAAERGPQDQDILEEMPRSVVTGRSLDEIAAGDPKKKKIRKKRGRKISARSPPKVSHRRAARSISTNNIIGAPKAVLPTFVVPSLATLSVTAPAGSDWLHEFKFDGYRLQARLSNGKVQLMTRSGLNWTSKFPNLAAAIAKIPSKAALIDGEAVVEDSDGISHFSLLQQALKAGDDERIVFYAFDLIHLDDCDLRGLPLSKRKRALGNLLGHASQHGTLRFSDSIIGKGPELLKKACETGLEGIISKRTNAPYRSGRGRDWIKTKCSNRQEFVVAGFSPSTAEARAIGALVLGFYDKGKLCYAGRTGTGFSFDVARALYRKLNALTVKKSPFDTIPKEERGSRSPIWVDPQMVVEIDFRGWTHGNRVRQASFQGEREDKPAREVRRETKAIAAIHNSAVVKKRSDLAGKRSHFPRSDVAQTRKSKGTIQSVKLTHPDRVYWQDGNITKQDLADYYTRVWPWMKPHLVGRPIALVRCPEGMDAGNCFFQKHATSGISTGYLHLVPEKGDKIISVNNLDGLISLVQAGALEIHIRGTTVDHREEANRLVFDLDPGPGVEWKDIVAAARDLRSYLDDIKLKTFIKTSGGKGLHVILPIEPTPWEKVKIFVRTVAEVLEADNPDRYVSTAAKVKRHNRIFIDYLRNSREATAIAPYSTRARPGAPVSTPIDWTELTSLKNAHQYTMTNILHRLARIRTDPWGLIGSVKQTLPRVK